MSEPQLATFGAGCFWGVEELFRKLPGVIDTAVGYMGGITNQPTYEAVCTDTTGHAEVVQVSYDPERISYEELLRVFWENHDPTTLNRQGPDIGTQYRSVIFFHSTEQQQLAQSFLETLRQKRVFKYPIVTQIVPATTFWKAEEYHQKYLSKQGKTHCSI